MTAGHVPVDELHESREDLALPGRFGDYLRFAHGTLLGAFTDADERALRAQTKHRLTTAAAAILGTLTLLASTVHVVTRRPPVSAIETELVAALLSVVAVLVGIGAAWHENWLVARYQAEQYRLLKFDFLNQEQLWTQPDEVWQLELKHRIQKIALVTRARLEERADEEHVVRIVSPEISAAVPGDHRQAISNYYLRRRLEVQIAYFTRMAAKKSWWPLENRRLVPIVFFGSIALLTVHLIRELDVRKLEANEPMRITQRVFGPVASTQPAIAPPKNAPTTPPRNHIPVFLLASLAIPAVWTGVRTFRGANEFGRNRARSAAKRSALTEVAERMEVDPPPHSLLQNVALAESVLAADQGEWLRLMLEAEWYG